MASEAAMSPPSSPFYERTVSHERNTVPRATSALSHVSNRSRRSSGSGPRIDLTETSKDKKRLHTKADPTQALNEAQPSAVALEESNLDDLRLIQHKDVEGNVITDPDRSNPTRHRLERPLDTIRAFQAAAEGTSSNRRSTYGGSRQPSQIGFDGGNNRRSSYYSANGYGPASPPRSRPGMNGGGYYRNSSFGFRPDSFIEETPGQPHHPPGRAMRYHPGPSSYHAPNTDGPAALHAHQPSYETMTSGSDETTNKSTNPSSQNSSFDHLHQLQKENRYPPAPPPVTSEYDAEFAPVSMPRPLVALYPGGQPENGDYRHQPGHPGPPRMPPGPPPPAKYTPNNPRVPIKLNGDSHGPAYSSQHEDEFGSLRKVDGTKRASWLKRAFSKRER